MTSAISLALHRQPCSRLIGWFLAILIAAPGLLLAAVDDIVGTWLRPDQTLVEFRLDGIVATKAAPVGTWEHLRDSSKYVVRFNGDRDFYYVTVGSQKRQLTMESQSRGTRTTLERVDHGTVHNPDAPDEKTALRMESTAIQAEIGRVSLALNTTKREASQFWSQYRMARLQRKPTSMSMKAKQKDAQAKGLELRLIDLRQRAALINAKLNSAK